MMCCAGSKPRNPSAGRIVRTIRLTPGIHGQASQIIATNSTAGRVTPFFTAGCEALARVTTPVPYRRKHFIGPGYSTMRVPLWGPFSAVARGHPRE